MNTHTCRACVLSCIDFRFHDHLNAFICQQGLDHDGTDFVRLAGAAKDLADADGQRAKTVLDQILVSHKLHAIREVYLVNHEDCGAYGAECVADSEAELARHMDDLARRLRRGAQALAGRVSEAVLFAARWAR